MRRDTADDDEEIIIEDEQRKAAEKKIIETDIKRSSLVPNNMEHLLTKAKLKELKEELKKLKTKERKEVAKRLKKAKELGDLSENAEYFEAREAQEQLEKKIYELEDIVHNAKIIRMTKGKDTVSVGATIKVTNKGKKLEFTIVGASEADPAKGYISNESPIGQAFIGKKSGESVKVETPSGNTIYKITKIA